MERNVWVRLSLRFVIVFAVLGALTWSYCKAQLGPISLWVVGVPLFALGFSMLCIFLAAGIIKHNETVRSRTLRRHDDDPQQQVKQSGVRMLLDWSEIVSDLTTDVLIAVFLSTSVGLMFWSMEQLEHGVVSHATKDAGKEITKEAGKEVFFAGVIALVTFAVLIMLRVAVLLQRVALLRDSTSAFEELERKFVTVLGNLKGYSHTAAVLAAEAGAGTALASLLKSKILKDVKVRDRRDPGTKSHALERTSRLAILTAAGQCADYLMRFADQDPKEANSVERSAVLLNSANEFLAETASDIARPNRLIVSNIRYITSLVCSTLIELRKLARYRQKGQGDWRPVWLVFTTYHPQIWFGEEQRFLGDTGIPAGTLHLQYWGRYLRLLRHLTGPHVSAGRDTGAANPPGEASIAKYWGRCLRLLRHLTRRHDSAVRDTEAVNPPGGASIASEPAYPSALCVRAFCAEDEQAYDGFIGYLKIELVAQHLHNSSGKLVYQTSSHESESPETVSRIAVALARDAAKFITDDDRAALAREPAKSDDDQVANPTKRERFCTEALGGPLAVLLGKIASKDDDAVRTELQEWYDESIKAGIDEFLEQAMARMHLWELEYLLVPEHHPRIDDLPHTRPVLKQLNGSDGPELTHLDGGPLEVLLDALMIFWESRQPPARLNARKAFKARWHSYEAAAAFCVCKPNQATDALSRLLCRMPKKGDVHAFGLVQKKNNQIDWTEATWLLAVKSRMDEEMGVARVDFLDLKNNQISLQELGDPGGMRSEELPANLSTIAQALEHSVDEPLLKSWRIE